MATQSARNGRDRLLRAALRLSAHKRSFSEIGVRELTRAADLSPGAFYRHFDNLEQLGGTLIGQVGETLKQALRTARREPAPADRVVSASLSAYFGLERTHRDALILCARERYGASADLRDAIRQLQAELAADLAEDIATLEILRELDTERLQEIALTVVEHMNIVMIDYSNAEAAERKRLLARAERFVFALFAGELALTRAPFPPDTSSPDRGQPRRRQSAE